MQGFKLWHWDPGCSRSPWNHLVFSPMISFKCALTNLCSLSLMRPRTDLKSLWSLLGIKKSRSVWSSLKFQSQIELNALASPLAQAEEAAPRQGCCLFFHPPFSPCVAPSTSPNLLLEVDGWLLGGQKTVCPPCTQNLWSTDQKLPLSNCLLYNHTLLSSEHLKTTVSKVRGVSSTVPRIACSFIFYFLYF